MVLGFFGGFGCFKVFWGFGGFRVVGGFRVLWVLLVLGF